MTPISTKITLANHNNLLNTKETTKYDVVNPGHDLAQAQKWRGLTG